MADSLDTADDFCNELTLVDLVVIQGTESLASELFYEIIKPKPAIAADKSFPYIASDEKCSLGEYPDKQREYWKTSKKRQNHNNFLCITHSSRPYGTDYVFWKEVDP